jgi:hypothetical protein
VTNPPSPAASDRGQAIEGFLSSLPKLHVWSGEATVGGLYPEMGRQIWRWTYGASPAPTVVETGAGATTLLFLLLGAQDLTSIAPDEELRDRIYAEGASRGIDTSALNFIVSRSELALPQLCDPARTIDVAFMDGGHGWPTVFVDFCYMNAILREGGILFLDDCQLYSVRQLALLLQRQPEFQLLSLLAGKLAVFRKTTTSAFLPDFGGQPFIFENSLLQPS